MTLNFPPASFPGTQAFLVYRFSFPFSSRYLLISLVVSHLKHRSSEGILFSSLYWWLLQCFSSCWSLVSFNCRKDNCGTISCLIVSPSLLRTALWHTTACSILEQAPCVLEKNQLSWQKNAFSEFLWYNVLITCKTSTSLFNLVTKREGWKSPTATSSLTVSSLIRQVSALCSSASGVRFVYTHFSCIVCRDRQPLVLLYDI